WIKNEFLPGVMRVEGCNDATDRIVEECRADTNSDAKLKCVIVAEKGFVLLNRLALIVENGPPARRPARADDIATFFNRSRLGLHLGLDGAAKAVRIGQTDLDCSFLII